MKSTDEIADQLLSSLTKDPILDEALEPLPNEIWKPLHSRFKKILDDSQTDTDEMRQMLLKKLEESKGQVIKGTLKDNYSQTGTLQVMLHNDGDIGIVISKGDAADDWQSVDITLATGPGGGSRVGDKVIHALISLIAAAQENEGVR